LGGGMAVPFTVNRKDIQKIELQKTPNKKEHKTKGLKKLRISQTSKTPDYFCENCKCKRYSPCGCIKATK